MTAYSPASAVGWLDLDAAASERVAAMLRALDEPGTLDPIGLGSIRDAIADVLSPGTSTIQTRLRYFVFLPWIFNALERERVAPGEFAQRLRDREARLIECLRWLGPNQGVIGYNAGRELRRMPSEIYWGGLGTWRIRRLDLSRSEYAKRAAALARLKPDRDDDGNVTVASMSMWAPMPDPPDDFLETDLGFELRRSEALVLVDHIRGWHPDSLLAALCSAPEVADVPFPWRVPASAVPPHLQPVLRHAECCSELMVGPQRLYNALLARTARTELGWDTAELETDELEALSGWADLIFGRHAEFRAWAGDISEFWAFLAPFESVSERTRQFVSFMVTAAVDDPFAFAESAAVQAAIADRELQLKTKRARLANRSALENWNRAPFGEQLNYRWPTTKSYLSDIARAMAQNV